MKVKLLKKIRRRYDWYINTKGNPVLYNKLTENYLVIDEEYYKKKFGQDSLLHLVIGEGGIWSTKTVLFNYMLDLMFRTFGHSYGKKTDRRMKLIVQRRLKPLNGKKLAT